MKIVLLLYLFIYNCYLVVGDLVIICRGAWFRSISDLLWFIWLNYAKPYPLNTFYWIVDVICAKDMYIPHFLGSAYGGP